MRDRRVADGAARSLNGYGIACACIYGVAGVLLLTIQPLAFGPLVTNGVLLEDQLALLAGTETAGLALTSAVLSGWLGRGAFRRKLIGLALVMAGCNIVSACQPVFWSLLAIRFVCGLAEGGILAGTIVVLLSHRLPERNTAIFLTVSNLIAAGAAFILPTWITPVFGARGGFYLMAAAGLIAALAAVPLRRDAQQTPSPLRNWRGWPGAAYATLGAIILQNAAVIIAWTFLVSVSEGRGFAPQILGVAASLGVLAQVAGSLIVAVYVERLAIGWCIIMSSVLITGSILSLGYPGGAAGFIVATMLMGFCWLAVLPMSIRLLIQLEPTRQAPYLVAAAQMLGLSIGPFAGAAVVQPNHVELAYVFSTVLAAIGVALFAMAIVGRRR